MTLELNCPATCPFVAASRPAELNFPLGQIHRLGAQGTGEVDESKRNVLKLLAISGVMGAAGGGLIAGTLQYAQPPIVGLSSYPMTQLIDVDGTPLTIDKVEKEYAFSTNGVLLFNYPLDNEPNFLINLSGNTQGIKNIPGGIGTDGLIVAYSAVCQHLGCVAPSIRYYPPGTCPQTFSTPQGDLDFYIHCSCHGSTYNPADSASNLTGPAVVPLPQLVLEADASGVIYATGMTPSSAPVKGHIHTLQGGNGVGLTSQLSTQTPPAPACSFPS
ncbi:MAG: Rieske 2Fe-2S domain-containing protein [Thermoplasmata archaeon]